MPYSPTMFTPANKSPLIENIRKLIDNANTSNSPIMKALANSAKKNPYYLQKSDSFIAQRYQRYEKFYQKELELISELYNKICASKLTNAQLNSSRTDILSSLLKEYSKEIAIAIKQNSFCPKTSCDNTKVPPESELQTTINKLLALKYEKSDSPIPTPPSSPKL